MAGTQTSTVQLYVLLHVLVEFMYYVHVVCIKQENTQYYARGRDGGCRAGATGGLRREAQGEPEAQGGGGGVHVCIYVYSRIRSISKSPIYMRRYIYFKDIYFSSELFSALYTGLTRLYRLYR